MCKKLHNPIFNELKGQLTLDKNDYIHEKKTLGKGKMCECPRNIEAKRLAVPKRRVTVFLNSITLLCNNLCLIL